MKKINIACVSDIHLGNPKNKASEIIANLKKAFPDDESTAELDILFLAGDVFDRLLSLPDEDVYAIDDWIVYILELCAKHNIMLRILDGTKSHDWFQSKRFVTIQGMLRCPVHLIYFRELAIEYIPEFDINVLYIPDEWQNTTERTLADVRELLKAKGLTKVDYAIMHGAFTYQLPEFLKGHKHDPEAYLAIVEELIFIGHIHTYSRHDRIIAQGSFDRLAHGEEEAKGHVRVSVDDSGHKITFVENKTAKIFKSVNCLNMTLEETISKVNHDVSRLPSGSFVRIMCSPNNPILTNLNTLIAQYPLFIWSKLVKEDIPDIAPIEEELSDDVYLPITITNSNIKNLLLDRMLNLDMSANSLLIAEAILNEVI